MSLPWRDEVRVGLCPDRLVVARRGRGLWPKVSLSVLHAGDDAIATLKAAAHNADLTVVLSSHFVRYAVLPWSSALKTDGEWNSYAQHAFGSTYGSAAGAWRIRLAPAAQREPRVACAVDAELIEALRTVPRIVSIQPYLMAAFNARRRALARASTWFVLQEPGRLTLSLIEQGRWKVIRTRQAHADWKESLAGVLEREAVAAGAQDCVRVLLCCEEPAPAQTGRYRVEDFTLFASAPADARPHVMALH